jgi:riboflavin kinase/FMN adenylyltransferase
LNTVTTIKNSTAIAIGGFDGMHVGHQALFNELGEHGTIVVIETGYANLTPQKERENFTHYPILYVQLDTVRHLDGLGFMSYLADKFPYLKKIVVGYDFHFGKDRRYSNQDLKNMCAGEVVIVDEIKHHNDSIHSHKIREKLKIGDIKVANDFLGHNYTVRGEHVRGQGLGAKELVATINIKTKGFLLPKEGVYATLTRLDDEEHLHPSVSFVGHRITTDGSYAVETHILDGEVFCQSKASISFISFIRDNEKFDTLEALNYAIHVDIDIAKKELKFLQL